MKKLLKKELRKNEFRVAIFGSSRINRKDVNYKEIYKLGKMLGERDIDIVTGGGPGLMMASSFGHKIGSKKTGAHAIALNIKLPMEQKFNKYSDVRKEFTHFTKRLDNFMLLSNAVVVAPGGVGTLLEFLYTWQLVQVEHVYDIPIIMLGEQWKSLIEWIKKGPLKHGLLKESDLDSIYVVKNADEAVKILKASYQMYKNSKKFKHG